MNHLDEDFQDKLENNMYWTLRGCEVDGFYVIPKTALRAIMNWAGTSTDPHESEDYYKNPRAMFVALDMIYTLLEELFEGPQHYSKWYGEFHPEWELHSTSEFKENHVK